MEKFDNRFREAQLPKYSSERFYLLSVVRDPWRGLCTQVVDRASSKD
jgi:hypothetical protein